MRVLGPAAVLLACVLACDGAPPPSPRRGSGASLAVEPSFVAVGDEVTLRFTSSAPACDPTWSVLALEEGSHAVPVAAGPGRAVISPDMPGTYEIEARGCGARASGTFRAWKDEHLLERAGDLAVSCAGLAASGGLFCLYDETTSAVSPEGTLEPLPLVSGGLNVAAGGNLLAVATRTQVTVVDIATRRVVSRVLTAGVVTPLLDGARLLTQGADSNRLFSLESPAEPHELTAWYGRPLGAALVNGRGVVVDERGLFLFETGPISSERDEPTVVPGPPLGGPVFGFGRHLVASAEGGTVAVDLDAAGLSQKEIVPFRALAFARVGRLLAMSAADGVFLVDGLEDGSPRLVGRIPRAVRLAGDATTLYTIPEERVGVVEVWRLR